MGHSYFDQNFTQCDMYVVGWSAAACMQMLNSVPQDLASPKQEDPYVHQLLFYKHCHTKLSMFA